MNSTVTILIVVVVLLVIALAAVGAMLAKRRRSEHLQEHYGAEYERTVAERGDRRAAEAALTEREKRHRSLDIRELEPAERDSLREQLGRRPARFRRQPGTVRATAPTRWSSTSCAPAGYPVDDFDRRPKTSPSSTRRSSSTTATPAPRAWPPTKARSTPNASARP